MPPLELQRSARRRRSATGFVRDGVIVVQLPAGLPTVEEDRLIRRLVDQVSGRARAATAGGDEALRQRADALADRFVDGVRAQSVAWSSRMRRRWGSCTPGDGTIRVSAELASFPDYVLDYVLVHELAHLRVPDHSPAFHAIVARYPAAERARGFLDGVRFGEGRYVPDPSEPSSDSSPPASSSAPPALF
jgi:hypothetical protein